MLLLTKYLRILTNHVGLGTETSESWHVWSVKAAMVYASVSQPACALRRNTVDDVVELYMQELDPLTLLWCVSALSSARGCCHSQISAPLIP